MATLLLQMEGQDVTPSMNGHVFESEGLIDVSNGTCAIGVMMRDVLDLTLHQVQPLGYGGDVSPGGIGCARCHGQRRAFEDRQRIQPARYGS